MTRKEYQKFNAIRTWLVEQDGSVYFGG